MWAKVGRCRQTQRTLCSNCYEPFVNQTGETGRIRAEILNGHHVQDQKKRTRIKHARKKPVSKESKDRMGEKDFAALTRLAGETLMIPLNMTIPSGMFVGVDGVSKCPRDVTARLTRLGYIRFRRANPVHKSGVYVITDEGRSCLEEKVEK